MVGNAPRIRLSSVISPASFKGTLKSQRTSTLQNELRGKFNENKKKLMGEEGENKAVQSQEKTLETRN